MRTRSSRSSWTRAATLLLVAAVALSAAPADASAASSTGVSVSVPDDSLGPGETTTVELVVTNADGGVGAFNASVSVDGAGAAVVDAGAVGNAEFERVDVADDGGAARVVAAALDTADTGPVTVATVTIRGTETGTSDLSVGVEVLADEEGRTYTVDGVEGASITVAEDTTEDGTDGERDGSSQELGELDDGSDDRNAAGGGDGDATGGGAGTAEDDADAAGDATTASAAGGGDASGSDDASPGTDGDAGEAAGMQEFDPAANPGIVERIERVLSPPLLVGLALLVLAVVGVALRRRH